jgi:hypothetical protein
MLGGWVAGKGLDTFNGVPRGSDCLLLSSREFCSQPSAPTEYHRCCKLVTIGTDAVLSTNASSNRSSEATFSSPMSKGPVPADSGENIAGHPILEGLGAGLAATQGQIGEATFADD